MAFGNIFRTVCIINMPNGVEATINKYVAAITNGSNAEYDLLLAQVATWYDGLSGIVENLTSTLVTYDTVKLYLVDDATGQEVFYDQATLTPTPQNTSEMLPSFNAALIAVPTVEGRGILKWFLPGIGRNMITADGLFSATAMVDLALAATHLLTGLPASGSITAAPIGWNRNTLTSTSMGSSSYSLNIPSHVDRRQVGVGS